MEGTLTLDDFGLKPAVLAALAAKGAGREELGRVVRDHGIRVIVRTDRGEESAALRGAARDQYRLLARPVVGDWVLLRDDPENTHLRLVTDVLPRASSIARKSAGREVAEQVVAANVDTAFITQAIGDLNPRRLERFVAIAREGGVEPVVVVTKTDATEDWARDAETLREAAAGARILGTSVRTGAGVEDTRAYLTPGSTVVLLGASGAGKSSLLNAWSGEASQRVGDMGADGKGRHTTTARSLLRLPSGALVIDTPGVREVGLLGDEEGVEATFEDVVELMRGCRFSDCKHAREPGCRIREALENGTLARERLDAFMKLTSETREARTLAREHTTRAHARVQARALRKRLADKGRKE